MDPFMLYANTMDIQHVISLHGARFEEIPDEFDIQPRSIAYTQEATLPKLGKSVQHLKLWGTNCVTIESEIRGRPSFLMSAGLMVKGPLTRTFNISATLRSDSELWQGARGNRVLDSLKEKLHIRLLDAFGKRLNAEDDPIMRSISPRRDKLSESDRPLSIFLDYARDYPRSNIAEDLICNDFQEAAPR